MNTTFIDPAFEEAYHTAMARYIATYRAPSLYDFLMRQHVADAHLSDEYIALRNKIVSPQEPEPVENQHFL